MVETERRGPDIAATKEGRPAREGANPQFRPAGRIEEQAPRPEPGVKTNACP